MGKSLVDVFRPLRWYRNVFMLAAVMLTIKLLHVALGVVFSGTLVYRVVLSFAALCLVASANYGINEVFDVETDTYHPEKRKRAIASGEVSPVLVLSLSVCVSMLGFLLIAPLQNAMLMLSLALLLISGVLYNIKPFRLKDKPYVDFIFEAINNPIRLMIGWYSIAPPSHVVPVSLVVGFWFLGIFLMAAKRFGELRFIKDDERAAKYRRSFHYYTEERLLFSMIAAAVSFSFLLGALSLKYGVDLMVMLPLLVIWIVWFFHLAYQDNTIVKDPERIFENKLFVAFSLLAVVVCFFCFFSGDSLLAWFFRK